MFAWFNRPRQLQAVFLNNTANSYHWGCYATSTMLIRGLELSGYEVVPFDVETTHYRTGEAPTVACDRTIARYFEGLKTTCPDLVRAVRRCDLIVVNGEGTLHRFHQAPRALLAIMRAAILLRKPVHLVNHSCFPSGGKEPASEEIEAYYAHCLRDVDRIVVREEWSKNTYSRLGIAAEAGFDCLPVYYDRFVESTPEVPPSIVLGAASNWKHEDAALVGKVLAEVLPSERKTVFLSGGNMNEPPEDADHYQAMREMLPTLEIVRPTSFAEWMAWFKSAKLVVTGRYHHLIAGATVSAPMVVMPGNTPKSDATLDILGRPPAIPIHSPDIKSELCRGIQNPLRTTEEQVAQITATARQNLAFRSAA